MERRGAGGSLGLWGMGGGGRDRDCLSGLRWLHARAYWAIKVACL